MYMYHDARFNRGNARSLAPIINGMRKLPKTAGMAGIRKKKIRTVVCGNFAKKHAQEELYTANADVTYVRAVLSEATRNKWGVQVVDVVGAFLNAPLPADSEDIFVEPPRILVQYGIIQGGYKWRAKHAVYGLRQAPRAWGQERDNQLRKARVSMGNGKYAVLEQSHVDSTVWLVMEDGGESESKNSTWCMVGSLCATWSTMSTTFWWQARSG
jgi:hypothetical protein